MAEHVRPEAPVSWRRGLGLPVLCVPKVMPPVTFRTRSTDLGPIWNAAIGGSVSPWFCMVSAWTALDGHVAKILTAVAVCLTQTTRWFCAASRVMKPNRKAEDRPAPLIFSKTVVLTPCKC